MPYVGYSPASNFASVTKDTFSGDGSTTAFTLSKAATTNGVAVFVENVRQEPTTAYAVSGTTLTFTAAPVSASGNNIYVLHHNTPASTATHPSAQDLTAANATLTGDVTVGSGTAADRKIVFDGNAQDYHIGLDDSADSLIIGKGSALGTTSHIVTDENGHVTMPLQSAFLARPTSSQTNIALNTAVTVVLGTEVFDTNGDFASNTFTAPVTGKYQLNMHVLLAQLDAGHTFSGANIITSNRNYQFTIDNAADFSQDFAENPYAACLSVLADMDANDTAHLTVQCQGGTQQTDINTGTSFSGYLVA